MNRWMSFMSHLRRRGRGLYRHDGGAAVLEFALVLPLLVVMLMGIIDFGRAWNRQQVITDAAREGARRAVVRDGADKMAVVSNVVQTRLTASGMTWDGTVAGYAASCVGWTAPTPSTEVVGVSGCGWGGATGSEARVLITAPYPFEFVRPVLGLLQGSGTVNEVVLSTDFVMRNE
jgi:Flp pilus assembly protein TadG